MTDNKDDILIKKFFDENITEIEDNGFSHRVMRRLPGRTSRINRIWTLFCAALGIAVFALCCSWDTIKACLYDMAAIRYTLEVPQIQPVTLVIAVLVLASLAFNNYVLSED